MAQKLVNFGEKLLTRGMTQTSNCACKDQRLTFFGQQLICLGQKLKTAKPEAETIVRRLRVIFFFDYFKFQIRPEILQLTKLLEELAGV